MSSDTDQIPKGEFRVIEPCHWTFRLTSGYTSMFNYPTAEGAYAALEGMKVRTKGGGEIFLRHGFPTCTCEPTNQRGDN